MQYCRIISLYNNNSVKFTSSREDNSATNDIMVIKIAHAQLHMYTNIMYKFQSSTCKTVGEKLRTKLCPQTDRQTDSHGDSSIPPLHFVGGGGITMTLRLQQYLRFSLKTAKLKMTMLMDITLTMNIFYSTNGSGLPVDECLF